MRRIPFYELGLVLLAVAVSAISAEGAVVSQYSHENTANRLQDDVDGNALTNSGGVAFLIPPHPQFSVLGSSAGYYDRTSRYLIVPNGVYSGGDFTFTGLAMKTGSDLYYETILASSGYRFQYAPPNNLNMQVKNGGGGAAANAFPKNQWQFVALTYRASDRTVQTYIAPSGASLGPADYTFTASNTNFDTSANFRLGMDGASGIGGGDAWLGYLDHTRVYNEYMTAAQLDSVFQGYGPVAAKPNALLARYSHDQPGQPLRDDMGANNLTNAGGVTFNAPIDPGRLLLGDNAGTYPRTGTGYLNVPSSVYEPGEDFTFTALVRKTGNYSGAHETMLAANLFRLQYREEPPINTGGGRLFLELKGAGSGLTAAGSFAADQWYFLAMRYDSINRVVDAFFQSPLSDLTTPVFTLNLPTSFDLSNMTNFRLGMDGVSGIGGGDPFLGQMDSVTFYRGYLSASELNRIMLSSVAPEPGTWILAMLAVPAWFVVWRRHRGTPQSV
jgi:hypothetical protein